MTRALCGSDIPHLSPNLKRNIGLNNLAVLLIEPHYLGRTWTATQQLHKLHNRICVALNFTLHLKESV